jgi:hypothetical protein
MLAAYPNIGVSGRVILRTNGATNEVADMNADNFTIGISGANTTYDFGN